MFSNMYSAFLASFLLLSFAAGEAMVDKLSVGAETLLSSKSIICNILDYGANPDDKTDVGPAIAKTFGTCVLKGGTTLYIPPGNYSSWYT
jgi:rhamnogalacturonan hydrolase